MLRPDKNNSYKNGLYLSIYNLCYMLGSGALLIGLGWIFSSIEVKSSFTLLFGPIMILFLLLSGISYFILWIQLLKKYRQYVTHKPSWNMFIIGVIGVIPNLIFSGYFMNLQNDESCFGAALLGIPIFFLSAITMLMLSLFIAKSPQIR
ncbi:hypothetical protein AB1283_22735 [Bacillus sp. S13(2024)]|uniref:hypothetical protein n=1 Tax=unclassified Bacillus (in: firmicutes) TaxID=185979 RepID=UPI003D1B0DCB